MRIPIPVLGAIVLALAAVYLVTVHTQTDSVVINGTALAVGQNVTLTLNYMPHTIVTYLNPSGTYQLIINAPGVDFAVGRYVYHEQFIGTSSGVSVTKAVITAVRVPPGPITVTIVLKRTA